MRAHQWQRGFLIGFLILINVWLISLIWGLVGKAEVAVSQAHQVQRQYAALEARKAALETNLATLDTPRGQDAAIRTAFGVARPGEEVIVVVPPTLATTTPELSWWQKVLGWLSLRN